MGKDQLTLTSLTSVRFNLVVKNTNANLEYGIKLFSEKWNLTRRALNRWCVRRNSRSADLQILLIIKIESRTLRYRLFTNLKERG